MHEDFLLSKKVSPKLKNRPKVSEVAEKSQAYLRNEKRKFNVFPEQSCYMRAAQHK